MKKILLTTAVLAAFGFSAGASAQVTVTTGGGYVNLKVVEYTPRPISPSQNS